jgi:hypothetical protein
MRGEAIRPCRLLRGIPVPEDGAIDPLVAVPLSSPTCLPSLSPHPLKGVCENADPHRGAPSFRRRLDGGLRNAAHPRDPSAVMRSPSLRTLMIFWSVVLRVWSRSSSCAVTDPKTIGG